MTVNELARPEILALTPYRPTPSRSGILLDNNESPWTPPNTNGDVLVDMNRYPVIPEELLRRVSAYLSVDPDHILLTRGSDDAIDALCRTFCRPGIDKVMVTPPTFGMYAISARIQGAGIVSVDREGDFRFPMEKVIAGIDATMRLVFVCSPNNPTGKAVSVEEIRQLCESARGKSIVVVDEAYAEFSSEGSAASMIGEFEHLVVLRTTSKALAFAAGRLGMLLAQPQVIDLVQRVLPPYPLPTPTVQAALTVFSDGNIDIARRRIEELKCRRDAVASELGVLPCVRRVHPSDANYLLVEFTRCRSVADRLQHAQVRVRGFSGPRLENCLRIGIGLRPEMDALLDLLGA